MSESWKRWQDWAIVVLGVLLFIAPFVFGATGNPKAAWTAYVGGVLLVIVGLWALSTPSLQFTDWAEIVIGALVFQAPDVLGFTELSGMGWSVGIAGIVAAVLGGSVLVARGRQQPVGQR